MTCAQGLLRLLWGGPEVGVLRHCFIVTVGKSFYFGDSSYITEVESRTQSLRPRTQKKYKTKAKDRLLEDRPCRGQGQKCSRSRTKDTTRIGLDPEFLIGGANHKSLAMTSSKIFKIGTFCGTKIS